MVDCVGSESFKNVDGSPFTMKLVKRGRNLNIVLKNNSSFSSRNKLLLMCSLSFVALSSLFFTVNVIFVTIVILLVMNLYSISCSVQHESLIVVESLGFQVETKYLLGQYSQFIPSNRVQNIFINEAILRSKVIYLLTFFLKENDGSEVLIPLFVATRPRLDCLGIIYNHLRELRM